MRHAIKEQIRIPLFGFVVICATMINWLLSILSKDEWTRSDLLNSINIILILLFFALVPLLWWSRDKIILTYDRYRKYSWADLRLVENGNAQKMPVGDSQVLRLTLVPSTNIALGGIVLRPQWRDWNWRPGDRDSWLYIYRNMDVPTLEITAVVPLRNPYGVGVGRCDKREDGGFVLDFTQTANLERGMGLDLELTINAKSPWNGFVALEPVSFDEDARTTYHPKVKVKVMDKWAVGNHSISYFAEWIFSRKRHHKPSHGYSVCS